MQEMSGCYQCKALLAVGSMLDRRLTAGHHESGGCAEHLKAQRPQLCQISTCLN